MTEKRRSRATEAFYGRRRGKSLRPQQQAAVDAAFPRYSIDLTTPAPADLKALFAIPVEQVRLEIGFGGGEHLLHRLRENPTVGYVGVEPFFNGMAKLMTIVADEPAD